MLVKKRNRRLSMKHLIDASIVSVNRIPVSKDKMRYLVTRFPQIVEDLQSGGRSSRDGSRIMLVPIVLRETK